MTAMTSSTKVDISGPGHHDGLVASAKSGIWPLPSLGLFAALAVVLLGSLYLFYGHFYSIHQDLGGSLLSAQLSETLGENFDKYSLYYPPAEKTWSTLAVWLSDLTGLRLDLAAILLIGVAVLFSGGLAYHIRRMTVGASPVFLVVSVAVLMIMPVLFKNVVGLREHMVVIGLWPYLVLRISDPDDRYVGWKTRFVVGLWLGVNLLLKYLYCIVVLLVELADAAIRRKPFALFRIENFLSGGIVAAYLFGWLVLDPSQRDAIAMVVGTIDANLKGQKTNIVLSATWLALASFFLLLAYAFKVPARVSVIGFTTVLGAVIVIWIQSRWYTHHLFPAIMACLAWWWMVRPHIRILWQVALILFIAVPVFDRFKATIPYQQAVNELDHALDNAGLSVDGKRVGMVTMHPSPFSQHLVSHGALRWNAGNNIAYVAAELKPLDRPENAGMTAPAITLEKPGSRILHDGMLRLWEDVPPDVLILDHSNSWPLRFVDVRWQHVFGEDERFNAILAQYEPVFEHDGKWVEFSYFVRKDAK